MILKAIVILLAVATASPGQAIDRVDALGELESRYETLCLADRSFVRAERLLIEDALAFASRVEEPLAREALPRLGIDVEACLDGHGYDEARDTLYLEVLTHETPRGEAHTPVLAINATHQDDRARARGEDPVASDRAPAPPPVPSRSGAARSAAGDVGGRARLADYDARCDRPRAAASPACFAAANAHCADVEPGTAGFVRAANRDLFNVACVAAQTGYAVDFDALQSLRRGCTGPQRAVNQACVSASGLWCQENGLGESAIVQSVDGEGLTIACLEAAAREIVPLQELASHFAGCDRLEKATTLFCTVAIGRWCAERDLGTAGFAQGLRPRREAVDVACVRPVRNAAVEVD